MDIKNSSTFRTDRLRQYEYTGDINYDYGRYGILNKCLPKILFKGNGVLVTVLQLIDMRLIMLFKYIDRVKFFKSINRFY